MTAAETGIEKLARISTDVSRAEITQFYAALLEIGASIEAGDLERARQLIGLSIPKITGIYGMIFLEVPDWCLPSLREELERGIAALRKHISVINQVRAHEKAEELEREAGEPPRLAN
jgi:hypothetical protein